MPLQQSTSRSTGKERDAEMGLDYFEARYLSSPQGRFTSPDPFNIFFDARNKDEVVSFISQPQNWNKYAYTLNNPLRYVDPTGEKIELIGSADERKKAFDYLCKIIGCTEGLGLTITEDDGRYFVDIQGDVDDFKNMNEQAYYLGNLIGDSNTVEFGVTSRNLAYWGGSATANPGVKPLNTDGANVRVLVNPDQTWIGDAKLKGSVIGYHRFQGWDQKPIWHIGTLTTEIAIWHEFGHAWGKIHGRLIDALSNQEAVGWENKMREQTYGPFGPNNAKRIAH